MDNTLRWSKYILPKGRKVYLTQRPDVAEVNSVGQFVLAKRPAVRFCFTDDIVPSHFTHAGIPWHWFPWVPGRNIPLENVFAFISSMDFYNKNRLSERSIWLHCDSSSMRAPTYFGLYLHAIYPDKVTEICEAMTTSEGFDLEYATYSRADTYADRSLGTDPGVQDLIKAWNKGGEKAAHEFYMNYGE